MHREHPYPTRRRRPLRWHLTHAGWAFLAYAVVLVGAVSAALYQPGA